MLELGPMQTASSGKLDVHRIDIGLGIDGDGFDIELAAGADDAKGYFTAVGDQDAFEHNDKLMVES